MVLFCRLRGLASTISEAATAATACREQNGLHCLTSRPELVREEDHQGSSVHDPAACCQDRLSVVAVRVCTFEHHSVAGIEFLFGDASVLAYGICSEDGKYNKYEPFVLGPGEYLKSLEIQIGVGNIVTVCRFTTSACRRSQWYPREPHGLATNMHMAMMENGMYERPAVYEVGECQDIVGLHAVLRRWHEKFVFCIHGVDVLDLTSKHEAEPPLLLDSKCDFCRGQRVVLLHDICFGGHLVVAKFTRGTIVGPGRESRLGFDSHGCEMPQGASFLSVRFDERADQRAESVSVLVGNLVAVASFGIGKEVRAQRVVMRSGHEVVAKGTIGKVQAITNQGKLTILFGRRIDHSQSPVDVIPDHIGYLRPEDTAHVEGLTQQFPFQGFIAKTERRGITLKQLTRILDYACSRCHSWHDRAPTQYSNTSGWALSMRCLNLYHINDWIIKPATKEKQCAFVEMLAAVDQIPEWFVSHWWGERIVDFVTSLRAHAGARCLTDATPLWVCAYANRQWSLSQDLAADPRQTSFYKAMKLARGVLLILDDHLAYEGRGESGPATPFTRVWCGFEQAVSIGVVADAGSGSSSDLGGALGGMPLMLDIVTCSKGQAELITDGLAEVDRGCWRKKTIRESNFPMWVVKKSLDFKIQDAQASEAIDRLHILNCIAERETNEEPALPEHPMYEQVNARLRSLFARAAWRQAVETGHVRGLELPNTLSKDRWCTCLRLDFTDCRRMKNSSLLELASGFPDQLQHLALDLKGCTAITDCCAKNFMQMLPKGLLTLNLTIEKMSDRFLLAISHYLPSGLTTLKLDMLSNGTVSDRGVVDLASKLPSTLRALDVALGCGARVTDNGLKALARSLPGSLTSLRLSARCRCVTHAGAEFLVARLPSSLQTLDVELDTNGEQFLVTLAHSLPFTLTKLRLLLGNWTSISADVAKCFATQLPASLQSFDITPRDMVPQKTSSISGVLSLLRSLPDNLIDLKADLQSCNSCVDEVMGDLAAKLPPSLQTLSLSLKLVGETGLFSLTKHLPASLRGLRLVVADLQGSSEQVVRSIAGAIPHGLQKLQVVLEWKGLGPCSVGSGKHLTELCGDKTIQQWQERTRNACKVGP